MLAQIEQSNTGHLLVGDNASGGAREKHLTPVRGRRDTGRAMNAKAEVILVDESGLPGVQSHPHLELGRLRPAMVRKRALPLCGLQDSIFGTSERHEQLVTVGID